MARSPTPTRLAALALLAALLFVAAAATALPEAPLRVLAPLSAHLVHLACAWALGRAILRLPGAVPREALDVLITSLAAGLAGLALLTLAGMAWLGARAWMPWAVDALALGLGLAFGGLREGLRRIAEPWSRRDMAVIVASRLPLHLALCLAALMHVVPPFLPATDATGAQALAWPQQAALRGDLAAAGAALPEAFVTPSQALLLHGWLTGGSVGALLFGATALGLLVAGVYMHANRHLGDLAAAWSALILLTIPLLLPEAARDPSTAFLLAFGFLAFHEAADWCQRATGGKIALASIYGGVLVAESPRGIAALLAVLAFLFLVQALLERNGILRQVPGVLGMAAIALLVALPFLGLSGWLAPDGPDVAVAERTVPEPLRGALGLDPRPAPAAPDPIASADSAEALGMHLAARALQLGPLLLGLLAVLPLVPLPSEALRHSVLAALLFAVVALLPWPLGGGGLLALAPTALAAGATATALVSQRGGSGRAGAAFVLLALPASAAMALALGPDTPLGTGVLLGRVDPAEYARRHVPDAAMIEIVRARGVTPRRSLLLVGHLTDVHYPGAHVRSPGLGLSSRLDDLAARPPFVEAVVVERAAMDETLRRELGARRVLAETPDGRFALLAIDREPEAVAEPDLDPAAEVR